MKKIFFTMAAVLAFWSGTQTAQMNSASGQAFTGGVIPITNQFAIPLTNGLGFTNTLVRVTNVPMLQMSDVITNLLRLQTNIEESLPVLSFLTTNINVVAPTQTTQFGGPFQPLTSNPQPLLTPTGAATGRQQRTSFSLIVGTNVFTIDAPTVQALVTLRDDLELALPELQALNGSSPTNAPNPGNPSQGINTLTPPAITHGFFTPFTNMPPPLIPGF